MHKSLNDLKNNLDFDNRMSLIVIGENIGKSNADNQTESAEITDL